MPLLLSRLQAGHFLLCSDLRGISARTSRPPVRALRAAAELGQTPEQLAEGALDLAVDAMAAAIRQVSLFRGMTSVGRVDRLRRCHRSTGLSIGGSLGLHEVLLHPLGGVLSAYGIGQARQRQLHQRAIRRQLDATLKRLPSMLRADLGSATDALRREGRGSAAAVDHQIRLELRDASSEQGLMPNLETSPEGLALHLLEDQFDRAHRQRFGYVASRSSLMAERLEVEVLETAAG